MRASSLLRIKLDLHLDSSIENSYDVPEPQRRADLASNLEYIGPIYRKLVLYYVWYCRFFRGVSLGAFFRDETAERIAAADTFALPSSPKDFPDQFWRRWRAA